MPRIITNPRRTDDEYKSVFKFLQSHKDEEHSIHTACKILGIKYPTFLRNISREQKEALWSLTNRKSRRYSSDAREPQLEPLPPMSVAIKPEPKPEATVPVDAFGFPRIIYRLHKNFVGTWSCVKMSFFIRVEADVYFVVGYQYELSEFPGAFGVDVHLHSFNTDVNTALAALRRLIDKKVGPEIQDEVVGTIQYSLTPVEPYDPRQILATTKVDAADGEYDAYVSGDLGRLEASGKVYQFALSENLPTGVMPCKVEGQKVTLFV